MENLVLNWLSVIVGRSSERYSTQDMICSSPPEAAVVLPAATNATERQTELTSTTIIIPKSLAALADNIEDDEDYGDEDECNNLEWSPRSARSIPSLLDDENAARIALRDRSNSELTLEPCLDSTIIETSQGLFLPQLVPEEGSKDVEAAPPLRRYTTPPSTNVKNKMGADAADATVAVTVTPPNTPESISSSRRSSSTVRVEEYQEDAVKHGKRNSITSTAKTPKRSNRGGSGTSSTNRSTPDEIDVTFNEIQRKKNLRIKNFFRRLAKSVRKSY